VEFAPAEVEVVPVSSDSLQVTWASRGPGVGYRLRYSTNPKTPPRDWPYIDCTEAEGLLTDLEPETTYYVRIRVISSRRTALTDYSEAVSATTL
jgi:hypothetical protein